ncbi:MAG TPA: helix-turn-helix transcriptional regulator [Candidatus Avimonoglobus intestinipullorum]|uniref:Helix-turn-helix transcriptional regulator n=1 Tax=Candidatus Avimonoglobus intestinipullorum TaxID=2840699 RepID=A0A9D1LWJ8_9FIRM|nr:helix-turn-helix transcriptional regulator [Candidatus Avimonoglobus intestinipullorum]
MEVEPVEEVKCEHCKYNRGILDKLKKEMPSEELVSELSDVFKVFGDATRIKILWVLFDKEVCVFDIAEEIGMSQSAVSHQLRVLKQARLVKSRRDGKNTFYSLDDEHVKRIIEQVMIHITE